MTTRIATPFGAETAAAEVVADLDLTRKLMRRRRPAVAGADRLMPAPARQRGSRRPERHGPSTGRAATRRRADLGIVAGYLRELSDHDGHRSMAASGRRDEEREQEASAVK
jgi:hypothetical protein